jgi:hypothetical protein
MTDYSKKGKCIWCLKGKPDVTFNNAPHTISRQLQATNIGFDICDSCNDYFGRKDKTKVYPMTIELAFKEIMGLMQLLLSNNLNEKTYTNYKSTYFSYYHTKRRIKVRKSFEIRPNFLWSLTRQFKRGIYEIFLQEYHRITFNGLDERFNPIRQFVKDDKGDLPIYFLVSTGVYFVEENQYNPSLTFSEKALADINDFGFYTIWMFGNIFFLEVTPRAEFSREIYLRQESLKLIGSGFIYSKLKELNLITDLDFTLRKLYH